MGECLENLEYKSYVRGLEGEKAYFCRNAKFNYTEDQETVGFVMLIGSNVNVSLEGFSAKNVSIPYGTPLFGVRNLPDYSQDYFRRVNIVDVTFEDIVEIGETRGGGGLIFDISGPEELKVRNLTARNIQFKSI